MSAASGAPPSLEAPVSALTLPRVSDIELEKGLDSAHWPPYPATPVVLQQLWRPMPQREFQPGKVWLAATGSALLIFAELSGSGACSKATADHQWLWELGDVFEIFLQSYGGEGYFEFQIAPTGHVLQLQYPSVGAPRQEGIDRYVRRDRLIEFAQRHSPETAEWRLAVRLPAFHLLSPRKRQIGTEWRLACCRYDYAADGSYCLSSTAQLSRPDFHRIGEWSRVSVPGGFALTSA